MLFIITFSFPISVLAETRSELEAEAKDINDKIKETESELAGVTSQRSTALNQINRLNSQINDYENERTSEDFQRAERYF